MTEVLAIAGIVLLLALLVWFIGAPLRRGAQVEPSEPSNLRALEAARDAKYAEIRDNELDYRTGKLSDEDFRALDRQLRAEAVAILRQLDELR